MNKRIVLVLASFPQLSETFIVNKFIGLLEKGWDVHVVCTHFNRKALSQFPQLTNVKQLDQRIHQTLPAHPKWISFCLLPLALFQRAILNFNGFRNFLFRSWKRHGLSVFKRFYFNSKIIALRPDLVHFEFGATAVGRADIGYLLGCKTIVSFRGYDLNFSGLDQPDYYTDVWKYADGFHFLGNDLRERGLQRGCPPDKPFALIPPAIDIQFFSPSEGRQAEAITSERPLRILSVGRLEWKKGYEYAFRVIKLLLEKGVPCEYHIIGAGSYLEPLAFARHQLGLEEVVSFLGSHPREKVKEEFEWADIFLHAAVSEGFCNAVLEAQAMRVPVVCSDADGLAENVEDSVTGYVVPRRDPVALTERIAHFVASPMLREQFGQAGRERVIQHFQLKDQIKKFEDFYRQILGFSEN